FAAGLAIVSRQDSPAGASSHDRTVLGGAWRGAFGESADHFDTGLLAAFVRACDQRASSRVGVCWRECSLLACEGRCSGVLTALPAARRNARIGRRIPPADGDGSHDSLRVPE